MTKVFQNMGTAMQVSGLKSEHHQLAEWRVNLDTHHVNISYDRSTRTYYTDKAKDTQYESSHRRKKNSHRVMEGKER